MFLDKSEIGVMNEDSLRGFYLFIQIPSSRSKCLFQLLWKEITILKNLAKEVFIYLYY